MKTPEMEVKRESFVAKKLKENNNENLFDFNNDFIYQFKETVWKEVVAKDDEHTKQVISDYAMKRAAEIGEKIRVVFIDKEVVDEIIELGIQEYLRREELKNGRE